MPHHGPVGHLTASSYGLSPAATVNSLLQVTTGSCTSWWIRLTADRRRQEPRATINWLFLHGRRYSLACLPAKPVCLSCICHSDQTPTCSCYCRAQGVCMACCNSTSVQDSTCIVTWALPAVRLLVTCCGLCRRCSIIGSVCHFGSPCLF
jgi:hypothetical protein